MVRWLQSVVHTLPLSGRHGLILVAAVSLSGVAMADAQLAPTPTATATPTPTAPPTPHGSVNLNVASAPSGTKITVTGTGFTPGEAIVVFLDTPDHALVQAVADGSGNFSAAVSLDGAAAGTHQVCVQQQPQPRCAPLDVQPPPPSPSNNSQPTAAPVPTATPNLVPVASPSGATETTAPSATASPTPAETLPIQSAAGLTDASSNFGGVALLLLSVVLIALSAAFVLWRRRAAARASPPGRGAARARILISYRQEDSAADADRLRDELDAHFGTEVVLMDVWRVEPGLDFAEAVDRALEESAAVIAVIGRGWLANTDDPDDPVRYEVATALSKGRRLFPVLVQGASLPGRSELPDALKPLTRRTAFTFGGTSAMAGLDDLIGALDHVLAKERSDSASEGEPAGRSTKATVPQKRSLGDLVPWIGAATAVLTAATGFYTFVTRPDPAVSSYQTQVIATCNRVQDTLSADHGFEVFYLTGPSLGIRKAGLERVQSQNLEDVRNEFELLNTLKAPDSLREKRTRAIGAQQTLYAVWQADLEFIDTNVRDGESLDELNVQYESRATADSAALARVSAAMSELANGECKLRGFPPQTRSTP